MSAGRARAALQIPPDDEGFELLLESEAAALRARVGALTEVLRSCEKVLGTVLLLTPQDDPRMRAMLSETRRAAVRVLEGSIKP